MFRGAGAARRAKTGWGEMDPARNVGRDRGAAARGRRTRWKERRRSPEA